MAESNSPATALAVLSKPIGIGKFKIPLGLLVLIGAGVLALISLNQKKGKSSGGEANALVGQYDPAQLTAGGSAERGNGIPTPGATLPILPVSLIPQPAPSTPSGTPLPLNWGTMPSSNLGIGGTSVPVPNGFLDQQSDVLSRGYKLPDLGTDLRNYYSAHPGEASSLLEYVQKNFSGWSSVPNDYRQAVTYASFGANLPTSGEFYYR